MKRKLFAALWLTTTALLAAAGAARAATWFAGDFLATGLGPAAVARGGAVIATASGADASYWNPAGLASTPRTGVSIEHAERFGGAVVHDALTAAVPLHAGALGVMIVRSAVDGITYADSTVLADPTAPLSHHNMPDPSKVRTFSNSDYVYGISWARRFGERFRAGATVKLLTRSIDETDAFGYGVDAGAQWDATSALTLGLALRDITTTRVSWDTDQTDVVYPSVHLGAAHTFHLTSIDGRVTSSATAAFGAEKAGYGGYRPWLLLDEGNPLALGVEFAWREVLHLRVGTRHFRGLIGPVTSHATAGAGVRFGLPGELASRAGLDVTWLRHTLGNSLRVGAVLEF